MLKFALHSYLPQRYMKRATFEQSEVSRHILDFKDGRVYATTWAAHEVVNALSCIDLTDTVIACVPASCQRTNTRRYKRFSRIVCSLSGAQNGFEHIRVVGKRTKLHLHRDAIIDDNVLLDEGFFNGKRVIVIDDICTTCRSANAFIAKLQGAGADIRMALFLGKTHSFRRC